MTLVPVDPDTCPECGTGLVEYTFNEDALVRHAGYRATRRTRRRACPDCYWGIVCEVSEVAP